MAETSTQATYPSGVYKHRETGEELIAIATEKFGNPQASAYVRGGFEYDRPLPKDAPTVVDPNAAPTATPMGAKSVSELEAELAEAKAREAGFAERRKEAEKEAKKTEDETETQVVVERQTVSVDPGSVSKGKK